MTNPRIKFLIDPKEDIKNANGFLVKDEQSFRWYFPKELWYLRDLSQKDAQKLIRKYVADMYAKERAPAKKHVKLREKEWNKVSKKYFTLISKLFDGYPWPKGPYRAYASIFYMYPRDVEKKTFSYPHRYPVWSRRVIAHEVLHFIFFDYVYTYYGYKQASRIKNREQNFIWKLGEAFNTMIENWKPYYDLIEREGGRRKPYASCVGAYKELQKQWRKHHNVKKLLDNILTGTRRTLPRPRR